MVETEQVEERRETQLKQVKKADQTQDDDERVEEGKPTENLSCDLRPEDEIESQPEVVSPAVVAAETEATSEPNVGLLAAAAAASDSGAEETTESDSADGAKSKRKKDKRKFFLYSYCPKSTNSTQKNIDKSKNLCFKMFKRSFNISDTE